MNPHIVIVGQGKLAKSIEKECVDQKISFDLWPDYNISDNMVILYCGSNRYFKEVSNFCEKNNKPLILLSTNVSLPEETNFPFLYTPNTSKEVRQFIDTVIDFASKTKYTKVSIIESHQSTKKDISGTARFLVSKTNQSENIITSIRDTERQLELGVPKEYLDGHAYHKITFEHNGVTTSFEVLVLGRDTYAKGAIEIAKDIVK